MVKRILNLLREGEKKELVKFAVSIFFSALLDFASLASFMPLLYFLLEGVDEVKAISVLPFMFAYVFIVRDKLKMYAREDFNAKKTQARIVSSPHLTILSIAHRESTLAYCTRIINLEENNG